jgi:AcrR family transcriptional regulator
MRGKQQCLLAFRRVVLFWPVSARTHYVEYCSHSGYAFLMAVKKTTKRMRRRPTQRRAVETVEAVLDATVRLLKRRGSAGITTNRIAEVAGVSIGSLYQYFPNRGAIFNALHQRHIDQIDRMIQDIVVEHAGASLKDLVRALIEAMVKSHAVDPALPELLMKEVPHRAGGTIDFAQRLHGLFLLAISSRAHELKKRRNLDAVVFVVGHMIDALSHGAALRRPPNLSLADAQEEAVRAVLAYLHS